MSSRRVFLAALLLLLAGAAGADAAPKFVRSARSGPWSTAETWEGGKVPGADANVQVRPGHTVVYDQKSDQPIRFLHVAGTLTFARDRDTQLVVGLLKIQPGDDATEDGFNCDAHQPDVDLNLPKPALEVGTAKNDVTKLTETAKSNLYKLKMEVFQNDGEAFLRYSMADQLSPNLRVRLFHSGPGTFWTNMDGKNMNLLIPTPGSNTNEKVVAPAKPVVGPNIVDKGTEKK